MKACIALALILTSVTPESPYYEIQHTINGALYIAGSGSSCESAWDNARIVFQDGENFIQCLRIR